MEGIREVKIKEILLICSTLDGILKPCFGPKALNTMLCTSSGQMIVASDSWTILNSLNLSHPLGQMIRDAVKNHVKHYGDGGKTFLFIMSSVLRGFLGGSSESYGKRDFIDGLSRLRHRLSEVVSDIIPKCIGLDMHSTNVCSLKEQCGCIIKTQMSGSFPSVTSEHLCNVLLSFLFEGISSISYFSGLVEDAQNNFCMCCLEAVGCSPMLTRILEGFVIQRDFRSITPELYRKSNIKILLANCCLDGEDNEGGEVYSVKDDSSLHAALQHKAHITELVVKRMMMDQVDLVVSSVNISNAVSHACLSAGISTIHMVDKEDMQRLSLLLGVLPINSVYEYLMDGLSSTSLELRCHEILLNGHKCVHFLPASSQLFVNTNGRILFMKHVLVTGPSKGMCCKIRTVLHNCLKSLHVWLTSDMKQFVNIHEVGIIPEQRKALSIANGGVFELFIYSKLKAEALWSANTNFSFACRCFAKALLQIPLLLAQNCYHPTGKKQTAYHMLHEFNMLVNGRADLTLAGSKSSGTEPLAGKVAVLCNVLDLIIQILRIDALVSVKMPLKQCTSSE